MPRATLPSSFPWKKIPVANVRQRSRFVPLPTRRWEKSLSWLKLRQAMWNWLLPTRTISEQVWISWAVPLPWSIAYSLRWPIRRTRFWWISYIRKKVAIRQRMVGCTWQTTRCPNVSSSRTMWIRYWENVRLPFTSIARVMKTRKTIWLSVRLRPLRLKFRLREVWQMYCRVLLMTKSIKIGNPSLAWNWRADSTIPIWTYWRTWWQRVRATTWKLWIWRKWRMKRWRMVYSTDVTFWRIFHSRQDCNTYREKLVVTVPSWER